MGRVIIQSPTEHEFGYQASMALKILTVAGGLILFGAMIWDRYARTKSARWVLLTLVAVLAAVTLISRLAGPGA